MRQTLSAAGLMAGLLTAGASEEDRKPRRTEVAIHQFCNILDFWLNAKL
jgi:hypothetical protein